MLNIEILHHSTFNIRCSMFDIPKHKQPLFSRHRNPIKAVCGLSLYLIRIGAIFIGHIKCTGSKRAGQAIPAHFLGCAHQCP